MPTQNQIVKNRVRLTNALREADRELEGALRVANAEIKAEIALMYATVGEEGWTYSAMKNTRRFEVLEARLNGIIGMLVATGYETTRSYSAYFATKGIENAGTALRGIGIDISPFLPPMGINLDAIDYIVQQPFDGRTFLDRLKGLDSYTKSRTKQVLVNGLIEGKGINPIIRDLRAVTKIEKSTAESIVKTYVMNADNIAAGIMYERAGIKKLKIVACLCNTCARCIKRDGKIITPAESHTITLHHNCQCVAIPLIPDEFEGKRYGRDHKTGTDKGEGTLYPPGTTAMDWIKLQPQSFQEEILGYNRMRLIRANKLEYGDLWNGGYDLIPMDELIPEEPILSRTGKVLRKPLTN